MKRDLDSNIVEKLLCSIFSILGIVFISISVVLWAFKFGFKSNALGLLVPAIVFISIGGSFLMTGIILLIIYKSREYHAKKVLDAGIRFSGVVCDYKLNRKVTLNYIHPYILLCDVYDPFTNRHRIFKSGNYWDSIDEIVGKNILVYVDSKNEKKYHVDLTSLYV